METKWIVIIAIAVAIVVVGVVYYLVFSKNDTSMTMGSAKLRSALVKIDKNSNSICSINLSFRKGGTTSVIPGIVFTSKNIFLIFQFRNKVVEGDYKEMEVIIKDFKKIIKTEDKLQTILLSPSKENKTDGYLYMNTISFKKLSTMINTVNSSSSSYYYPNEELMAMLKRIGKAQR